MSKSTALTVTQPSLDYRAALRALTAAAEQAEGLGVQVSIAVVGRNGQPLAQLSLNSAPPQTAQLALRKARTSAGFKVPSQAIRERNEQDIHLLTALDSHPDMLLLGGGLPLLLDGECIGAIGVSGASQAQDIACAEAGLATLGLTSA
ncbi:GlcG/HbpS family heme-binding protein [Marinobacterium weihaiense]|uniref:Heme-binding protein n=1 Tax=Marinobacterium weihaiense TaxID=2851016 RepID=A0ABS6MAA0_9GAMM|nr:heme-binding protein [Marinobacterium weihaiense]MBV0933209.1 heme-binding protein [Marinobacterium weihaiense]